MAYIGSRQLANSTTCLCPMIRRHRALNNVGKHKAVTCQERTVHINQRRNNAFQRLNQRDKQNVTESRGIILLERF